jgi:hypothetical protein
MLWQLPEFDHFRRYADSNAHCCYIPINYCTSPNYRTRADSNATQDHCVGSDPNVILDNDVANNMALLTNKGLWIVKSMSSRPHHNIRANQA